MIKKNFLWLTNIFFEEEELLIDKDTDKILAQGDFYHDKIDSFIEGYIFGVESCGYEVNIEKKTCAHPNFVVQEEE